MNGNPLHAIQQPGLFFFPTPFKGLLIAQVAAPADGQRASLHLSCIQMDDSDEPFSLSLFNKTTLDSSIIARHRRNHLACRVHQLTTNQKPQMLLSHQSGQPGLLAL